MMLLRRRALWRCRSFFLSLCLLHLAAILGGHDAARAADFYQGKTLTLIVGYAPGGGVDATARVIAHHLVRFIPGQPGIVVQNMEGAAGLASTNYLDRRVAPDGLTIAIPGRSWYIEGIVRRPGVTFDPVKLTYIGSPGRRQFGRLCPHRHRHQDLRRPDAIAEAGDLWRARRRHAHRHGPEPARRQRRADQGRARLRLDRARAARPRTGRDRRHLHRRQRADDAPGPCRQGRADRADRAPIAAISPTCATSSAPTPPGARSRDRPRWHRRAARSAPPACRPM